MSGKIDLSRIRQAGLIAVVLAVIVNSVIRIAAVNLLAIPAEFMPLGQPYTTIFFTIIGVGGGAVVYYVLARRAARPVRTFRLVVIVVLLISLLPDLLLLLSDQPGASVAGIATLMFTHVVAAAICYFVLTMMTVRN